MSDHATFGPGSPLHFAAGMLWLIATTMIVIALLTHTHAGDAFALFGLALGITGLDRVVGR